MGWGGLLLLMNATPYTWHKIADSERNSDLNDWTLPDIIAAGTS